MSKDHIRYDLLVQNALKGVVRKVLADASREGLPPDHHFYVSFRTDVAGAKISNRLKEKYPEEMTIVLQHQFWDLNVTEALFEVGLSFGGVPERLVVPFDAITGFYDPSVEFGLKFEVKDDADGAAAADAASEAQPRPFTPRSLRERAAAAAAASETLPPVARIEDTGANSDDADAVSAEAPAAEAETATKADADAEEPTADAEEAPASGGAQVVSLDAFRKKH